MRKKVCKNCMIIVKKEVCPICKGTDFRESFQGRINVLNAEKSEIAKKINITAKGEYAIRVR